MIFHNRYSGKGSWYMNRDIEYLESIIRYCDNIGKTVSVFGNDEEDFFDNLDFQHSCAFKLSQIGEIVKKLSTDLKKECPETEWSDIAKLRDVISHRYEGIELRTIWEIIT